VSSRSEKELHVYEVGIEVFTSLGWMSARRPPDEWDAIRLELGYGHSPAVWREWWASLGVQIQSFLWVDDIDEWEFKIRKRARSVWLEVAIPVDVAFGDESVQNILDSAIRSLWIHAAEKMGWTMPPGAEAGNGVVRHVRPEVGDRGADTTAMEVQLRVPVGDDLTWIEALLDEITELLDEDRGEFCGTFEEEGDEICYYLYGPDQERVIIAARRAVARCRLPAGGYLVKVANVNVSDAEDEVVPL